MRIGWDLHSLNGKYQGIRTHVIELFSRVARECREFEFLCFLEESGHLKRDFPAFDLPNVTAVELPSGSAIRRLAWDLPRLARRTGVDLFHSQYITPLLLPCPSVVTVHDVLFDSHPEFFPWQFRMRSRILMGLSMRSARHVFTVSAFSKSEIERRYGIGGERISSVPNAVDPERFFPGDAGEDVLARYGLRSGSYILSVGRLDRRKNHAGLIEAHARLGCKAPPLVIVGQPDFGAEEILKAAGPAQAAGRLSILQDVTDTDLPVLYRHSMCFVFPSLAEGFGMPPLEAMASGTPTIVARNTAIPEVVGSSALMVENGGADELEAILRAMIGTETLRRRMSRSGVERAKAFSWDTSAATVAGIYRSILLAPRRSPPLRQTDRLASDRLPRNPRPDDLPDSVMANEGLPRR